MNFLLAQKIYLYQYQSTELLEAYLGNPYEPNSLISFKKSIELDADEVYPDLFIDNLKTFNFHNYYTPKSEGGKLTSFEELVSLYRVISRRDPSLAISEGHTFMAFLIVWMEGTPEQKRHYAAIALDGKSACFGLNEKSRFQSNSLDLKSEGNQENYIISGEKRVLNKSTRSDLLCVLVSETEIEEETNKSSFFLIDKSTVNPDRINYLPKISTLGIKGCDFTGIRFDSLIVDKKSRIGEPGTGEVIAEKAFQLKRLLCNGLLLGMTDTAIRTSFKFIHQHNLTYHSQKQLRTIISYAAIELFTCECLSTAALRALQVIPGYMQLWALITKYVIQSTCEKIIAALSGIFVSQYYGEEIHDFTLFQKISRDHSIINLFDGGSITTLQLLIGFYQNNSEPETEFDFVNKKLNNIFSLTEPLPHINFQAYNRSFNTHIPFTLFLNHIKEKLDAVFLELTHGEIISQVKFYLEIIHNKIQKDEEQLIKFKLIPEYKTLPEYQTLLIQQFKVFSSIINIEMWLTNLNNIDAYFNKGEWLVLCLEWLMKDFTEKDMVSKDYYINNLSTHINSLYSENKLISLIAIPLGYSGK